MSDFQHHSRLPGFDFLDVIRLDVIKKKKKKSVQKSFPDSQTHGLNRGFHSKIQNNKITDSYLQWRRFCNLSEQSVPWFTVVKF